MFRNNYSSMRSRSLAQRNLEDFNLMEHVIHSVASLSRAGREPSYRKTNQDNCFAYQQYLHPSQALFGTMDGHGPNGHKVCGRRGAGRRRRAGRGTAGLGTEGGRGHAE